MKIKYNTKFLPLSTPGTIVVVIENKFGQLDRVFKVNSSVSNILADKEWGLICRDKSGKGMYEKFLRLATPEEIAKYKKEHNED